MGYSNPMQPELENNLQNQINIAHNLFNTILATVRNREELEWSWLAISRNKWGCTEEEGISKKYTHLDKIPRRDT